MAVKINIDASFFNEKFIPYLNSQARYNVFYGGAGSGKSFFLASKFVIDLFKEKKKLMVVRQTFSSIRDSVHAEIVSALERMKLIEYVKISKTSLNITFPNGSTIIFKGSDDENKLLSISGIDIVWIEEASEISKDIFNQLELRLRGGTGKKQFFLSFNPVSKNSWLYEEFFANPKKDCVTCHSTYKDNPHLDQEYIDNLLEMKKRNPQKYEVYGKGAWGVHGKRVFENWEESDFNVNKMIQENPNKYEAVFGLDFGYTNDPSAFIASLIDLEDRVLYIFDEMYEKGLLNNQIAERIIEMGYAKESIIADSAEQKSIQEIKNYGIQRIKPAKKGGGSIMAGIQYIQQFKIYVHPKCKHTMNELDSYSYKKDRSTGMYLNQVQDANNHLMDSLRYSLEQFSRRSKPVFLDKSVFGL